MHSAPDAKEADGLLAAGALTNTDIEQLRPLLEQVGCRGMGSRWHHP